MTVEDDIAIFQRVPMLALLGADALRITAIGAETRYIHQGETLFSEGERADCGYVVQEGSFALTSQHRALAVTAGPGSLLGEMALVTETVRRVTAVAREPSSVIRISRSMFLRMLEGYPAAAAKLHAHLAARLQDTAQNMTNVVADYGATEGGR